MARHLVKYFKEISAKRETALGRKRPKFDNGRKPRGIYHTDPADKEFNDTLKNAGKKLEVHIGFGRPCKLREKRQTVYAYKCEAHESTREHKPETQQQRS